MTGIEYLTPDGQQLTLDVTACVVLWGGGGGLFCQSFSQSSNFQTKFPVDKMFTF